MLAVSFTLCFMCNFKNLLIKYQGQINNINFLRVIFEDLFHMKCCIQLKELFSEYLVNHCNCDTKHYSLLKGSDDRER